MYKIKTIALVAGIATMFTACNDNKVSFDASGSFEAEETIISSEATGTIKRLEIEEGQTLEAGQNIGYIDSLQLYLKKKQLEAQVIAILGKKPNISVQLSALQDTIKNCRKGKNKSSQFGKRRCSYTQAVRRHQRTN
jgi:HlyD family secretion protein